MLLLLALQSACY